MVNLRTGKEKDCDEFPRYIPLEWKGTAGYKAGSSSSPEGRKSTAAILQKHCY